MLVLSREKGESIVLLSPDDTILAVVSVNQIKPSKVRIGIEAPDEINIRRGEHVPAANRPKVELIYNVNTDEWVCREVGGGKLWSEPDMEAAQIRFRLEMDRIDV